MQNSYALTQIIQSLYFLNQKFEASSHLLWPCSPVCVRPGWDPSKTGFLVTRLFFVLFQMQKGTFIWTPTLFRIQSPLMNMLLIMVIRPSIVNPPTPSLSLRSTVTTSTGILSMWCTQMRLGERWCYQLQWCQTNVWIKTPWVS